MSAKASPPKVYIITWCNFAELLYGSTLVFDTLRVGFPNAEVVVVDNASNPELREPIRKAAMAAGCRFEQQETQQRHWQLLETLTLEADRATVFVDPDVIFWERVEDWEFDGALMAGRFLPEFADPFSRTFTMARLHTSHLWFPDPAGLRERIAAIRRERFEAGSLFEPRMLPPGWWRWDTASALYHALGAQAAPFDEGRLNAYDHLFCGSHLPLVLPTFDPQSRALMADAHARAQTDPASLRGIWRPQEAYFASRPWSGRVADPTTP